MFIGHSLPKNSIAIFVFLFSILLTQIINAQGTGTLKGSVIDKATGDGLVGANVIIQGTSLGVAADLDGNFQIKLIPAGKWKVKVSCVGYSPVIRDITIRDGGTTVEEFRLTAEAIIGEEVVVTAQARGQVQAINQQLASDKIVNIVSEARIQELPDFNAAAAISRLPGVSTTESSGEANKVVIRGLAPQYNAVAVGGITLASTGSQQIGATSIGGTAGVINNDRSVDLTMVTPYMIKSIEVYKSLTPDMNANAIGGFVNMNLREAPSGLRTDFMFQRGYTYKTNNYDNFRGVASISNRFFDDAIGVYLLGNMEKYDRDADNMTASYSVADRRPDSITGYQPVRVQNVTLNRHKEVRRRFGANLILDYKFETGILRSINMFSRLNSNFQDHNQIIDYEGNGIGFRYREGRSTVDLGVNSLEFENDFGFFSMDMKFAWTYSRNYLPNSPFYQLRQTTGVTAGAVPPNTIPESLAVKVRYLGDGETYLNSVSLFTTEYKERGGMLKGDFKIPFNITSDFTGHFKLGGVFHRKTHKNDQETPYFQPAQGNDLQSENLNAIMMRGIRQRFPEITFSPNGLIAAKNFTSLDRNLYKEFLGNRFTPVYWICEPTLINTMTAYVFSDTSFDAAKVSASRIGGWFYGGYQRLPNDYEYIEKYYAGYLMTQINFGPNIMFVGGARYEEIDASYRVYILFDGRHPATQRVYEKNSYPKNHYILPMGQLKMNIFNWFDIRLSITKTLARPDYHQLSPRWNMDYSRMNVWAGNPKLKPAEALNYDAVLTYYDNVLGLFSIGGFYKEVTNFTFYTSYKLRRYNPAQGIFYIPAGYDSIGTYTTPDGDRPQDGARIYTYMNSLQPAYVKGIEIDLQTRFWYLPFPLDGLLLGFNYSHVWSKANYPFRDEITYGRPAKIWQVDSTREGRLINQPNDIANAFIGYDYKGFSAKLSFVFQGNSVSNIGAYPVEDGFTTDYYRVDFAVRQKLPITGLQLFFDVNNINNRMNEAKQISIGGFTRQQHYGLVANLGLRYEY